MCIFLYTMFSKIYTFILYFMKNTFTCIFVVLFCYKNVINKLTRSFYTFILAFKLVPVLTACIHVLVYCLLFILKENLYAFNSKFQYHASINMKHDVNSTIINLCCFFIKLLCCCGVFPLSQHFAKIQEDLSFENFRILAVVMCLLHFVCSSFVDN